MRTSGAVLVVGARDVEDRQLLVLRVLDINILILHIQIHLPHLRPIFERNSYGFFQARNLDSLRAARRFLCP